MGETGSDTEDPKENQILQIIHKLDPKAGEAVVDIGLLGQELKVPQRNFLIVRHSMPYSTLVRSSGSDLGRINYL
jgi:hypothetical protein